MRGACTSGRESACSTEVARVGAYARRFTWSDGHTTGLYTFAFLRSLDKSGPTHA